MGVVEHGPKDHINIRILRIGYKPQDTGIPENIVCRILTYHILHVVYIYIYIYTVYTFAYRDIFHVHILFISLFLSLSLGLCIYIYTYTYVYIQYIHHIGIHICIYTHMYIHIHYTYTLLGSIYTYIYIYRYTIHTPYWDPYMSMWSLLGPLNKVGQQSRSHGRAWTLPGRPPLSSRYIIHGCFHKLV